MMRLLFALLLLPSLCFANGGIFPATGGWVYSSGGGAITYLVTNKDFEDPPYTDGTEWVDANDGWLESSASARYYVSSAVAYDGTQSGRLDGQSTSEYIYQPFTAQTQIVTMTMRFYATNAAAGGMRIVLSKGNPESATRIVYIKIDANDLAGHNGSDYDAITTGDVISDNTWYKIDVELDVTNGVYKVYLDDVQQGTTYSVSATAADVDGGSVKAYSSPAAYSYIDDFAIYEGVKQ